MYLDVPDWLVQDGTSQVNNDLEQDLMNKCSEKLRPFKHTNS